MGVFSSERALAYRLKADRKRS